jgi:hypothetical protein
MLQPTRIDAPQGFIKPAQPYGHPAFRLHQQPERLVEEGNQRG